MHNGKIDRQALPSPDLIRPESERRFAMPRTLTEEMLARIWAEVLGLEQVGVHDSFFELGGHSLLAVKLMHRMRQSFEIEVPLRRLFETPTIAGLAEHVDAEHHSTYVEGRDSPETWSSLIPIRTDGTKRPFFLVPGGGGGEGEFLIYAQLIQLLGSDQPVYGLVARGLNRGQLPHTDVETMAADYIQEIRHLQPEGPYVLGGECIGGRVALEMAHQLQNASQQVVLLVLMNTIARKDPHSDPRRRIMRLLQVERIRHHWHQLRQLAFRQRIRYTLDKVRTGLILTLPLSRRGRTARHIRRVRAHYRATLRRYRPQPYPGRITLLLSEDHYQADPTGGWQDLAAGGLDVHKVPGDHDSYIGTHVQTTARQLSACLSDAHRMIDGGTSGTDHTDDRVMRGSG